MANKYANLVGTNKIKDEYTKINTGFDRVEADINKLKTDVTAVNTRVDTIITTPISGEAATQEIVDARVSAVKSKTFATLDARFEETEQDIATHMADSAPHPEANFATKDYVQDNTMFIFPYTSVIVDANLGLIDGIYPVGDTLKNGPYAEIDANNQGTLIVLRWRMILDDIIQIHVSIYGSIYVRMRNPLEGWAPWRKVIDSGVLMFGNGSPEGVVTAPVGTLYRRADGGASSTLYVKESGTGNTGWKAVQTI